MCETASGHASTACIGRRTRLRTAAGAVWIRLKNMGWRMSDRIYCEYDTIFFADGEDYVFASCEESDIEEGCGWSARAVNSAPRQSSGIAILEFRQLQELNALHKAGRIVAREVPVPSDGGDT